MHPKLSIITVNLNNAEGLKKTIESVVSQTFTDYEYIIIDGGSTDGSIEIIKQYADKITYWVSEPDKGIYNAMNKGIKVAKGEYCLFLNSGDWLINENILREILNDFPNVDIIFGNILTSIGESKSDTKITLKTFFERTVPHMASFIKRTILQKNEYYNENFKIVSDWEFFIKKLIISKCTYHYIDKVVSYFDSDGISNNKKFELLHAQERETVLKELFPLMYDDYIELTETKKDLEKCQTQLSYYNNSKLVQFVKKIQQSNLYKKIRKKKK